MPRTRVSKRVKKSDDEEEEENQPMEEETREKPKAARKKRQIVDEDSLEEEEDKEKSSDEEEQTVKTLPKSLPKGLVQSQKSKQDEQQKSASQKEPEKEPEVERVHSSQREVPKGPMKRLMITHMVLENFKSYAGEVEIGPYHHCFSSVVGPNGSGKSNVIDALLFVFGKRASQLRHKTVAELIHHSDTHPDLQYCQVSVHFQEIIDLETGESYEVVPGSSMVVSRRAKKNNQSDYFMNKKKSQFTDVEKWLNEKGIDLDNNRFLILQGEVEQIAMMKPKSTPQHGDGLLEYLEEIIGSNKYVELIDKKSQEIEEATEARQSVLNRVKVAEKEKEGLEGAKNEAEAYLTKEREIIDKQSILYQIHRANAEEHVAHTTEKKEKISEQLREEQEKASDSTKQLEELETQYKQGQKEFEAIEQEMAKAKSDFGIYERKQVKYDEDIKHYKKKEKQLAETMATETKKVKEKMHNIDNYKRNISNNEKEVEEKARKVEVEQKKLDAIYESLKEETADLQAELEVKQKELMPWSKKLNELQSKYDIAKSELDIAKDKFDTAQKRLDEVQLQLQNIKESLPRKKKETVAARKELEDAKAQLERAKKDLKRTIQNESELSETVRNLRNQLEEAKSSAQDASSKNQLLKALDNAKAKKKLSGIHGRLGDLGTIPQKYDVAISTACGALNNIVVDTTANAEKCIQFIRDNNLGVVTCIILEQQQRLQAEMTQEFKPPEKSERLFDLIKPKEASYLPAFYYALRNTLVAPDLDTASKIAYSSNSNRHRVVTLDGALIDASGTMSGGGTRVASGGMKASFSASMSEDEMNKLQKEFDTQADRQQNLRNQKQDLETEIENLTAKINSLEVDIPKLDMDITTMGTQEKELKARVPELEALIKPSSDEQKQISALQKSLSEKEKDLNDTKKAASKLEETVQDLHKQIIEAGGTRLQVQKSKVTSLNEQIDTLNTENTKLKVKIKTTEKEINKAKAAIEDTEKQLEQIKASLEDAKKESAEGDKRALEVKNSYKETGTVLEEKTKELKVIQKNFEKLKKVVDKFRTLEVDLTNQVEDLNRIIKEQQAKATGWVKKISDLEKQKARTRIEDLNEGEEAPEDKIAILSVEELNNHDSKELTEEIALLEQELAKQKPNMNAIREYRKKEREYLERTKELETATNKRDGIRKEYEALRKKRLDEFMAGFSEITLRLKEMYQMITLGGDAELELVDSLDPFSEGIVFSVRPPKKSWKNISNLSGGEKTLSSLALVFALHHYKPTPLYVMDEIDAALDFKNVSIVANYIKERTKNAQFIIISLRNYMFELADHLVGIFKTHDCSKSVTINPAKFSIPGSNPITNNNNNVPTHHRATPVAT